VRGRCQLDAKATQSKGAAKCNVPPRDVCISLVQSTPDTLVQLLTRMSGTHVRYERWGIRRRAQHASESTLSKKRIKRQKQVTCYTHDMLHTCYTHVTHMTCYTPHMPSREIGNDHFESIRGEGSRRQAVFPDGKVQS